MNVSRLIVLSTLAEGGPMYGHQIRRLIETVRLEAWSTVRVGSLYNAIRRLESEHLIEVVGTEQKGRLPVRTFYAITMEGRRELALLRAKGLREVEFATDPFDVTLWTAAGLPQEQLEDAVSKRLEKLRGIRDTIVAERESLELQGFLPAAGQILFRHGEYRVEAEIRWHEELLDWLPRLAEQRAAWPVGGPWEDDGHLDEADADQTGD